MVHYGSGAMDSFHGMQESCLSLARCSEELTGVPELVEAVRCIVRTTVLDSAPPEE